MNYSALSTKTTYFIRKDKKLVNNGNIYFNGIKKKQFKYSIFSAELKKYNI